MVGDTWSGIVKPEQVNKVTAKGDGRSRISLFERIHSLEAKAIMSARLKSSQQKVDLK